MHEGAGAVRHGVHNALGRRDGGERGISAGDTLPQRHDVGSDAVGLHRPPRPRPAHPDQDFVGDQQDVVTIADLPHSAEVFRSRRGAACGRSAHRLRDERSDLVGAEPRDRLFEDSPAADRTGGALAAALAPIRIGRRDAVHVHEPGPEHRLEQGAAVVARRQGDDPVLGGSSALDPILPRELQRRLDGLRSTTEEVELGEIARQRLGNLGGELLDRAVREHRAREVAELPRLLGDCLGDFWIGVTQVGDVGAPDRIKVALAAVVDQPAPLAAHDPGVLVPELPVENVALGVMVGGHPGKATVAGQKGRAG